MNYSNTKKREIVKEDYDAIAEIYSKSYGDISNYKCFLDNFLNKLNGKTILDVGCGAGQIAGYLFTKGYEVTGVDFSKKLLQIAAKNYPNVTFIETDICEYQPEQKYDGIITKDMLFHIPDEDLKKVFSKFKKILRTNGVISIIMDMPKKEGEHIFVEELDERYKIYYNYLLPIKIKHLLEQSGFEIEEMQVFEENENASSYASGLMVFSAKNIDLIRTKKRIHKTNEERTYEDTK